MPQPPPFFLSLVAKRNFYHIYMKGKASFTGQLVCFSHLSSSGVSFYVSSKWMDERIAKKITFFNNDNIIEETSHWSVPTNNKVRHRVAVVTTRMIQNFLLPVRKQRHNRLGGDDDDDDENYGGDGNNGDSHNQQQQQRQGQGQRRQELTQSESDMSLHGFCHHQNDGSSLSTKNNNSNNNNNNRKKIDDNDSCSNIVLPIEDDEDDDEDDHHHDDDMTKPPLSKTDTTWPSSSSSSSSIPVCFFKHDDAATTTTAETSLLSDDTTTIFSSSPTTPLSTTPSKTTKKKTTRTLPLLPPSSREVRKKTSRVISGSLVQQRPPPPRQSSSSSSSQTETDMIIFGGRSSICGDIINDNHNDDGNDDDDDDESIGFFSPTTGRSTIPGKGKLVTNRRKNKKKKKNDQTLSSSSSSNLVSIPPDLFPLATADSNDDDGHDDDHDIDFYGKNKEKTKTSPEESAFHSSFDSASLTLSQLSGWSSYDTDFDEHHHNHHDNDTTDTRLETSSRRFGKKKRGGDDDDDDNCRHGSFASRSHSQTIRKGKKSTFTGSGKVEERKSRSSSSSSRNGVVKSLSTRSIGSGSNSNLKSKTRSECLGDRSIDKTKKRTNDLKHRDSTDYHNHTTRSHRTTGSLCSSSSSRFCDENMFVLHDSNRDHKNSSGRLDGDRVSDLQRSVSSVSSSDRGSRRRSRANHHHHHNHPTITTITRNDSSRKIHNGSSSKIDSSEAGREGEGRDSSSRRTKHSGRKVDKFLSASEIDDLIGHCLTPEIQTDRKTIADEPTAAAASSSQRKEGSSRPRPLSSKSKCSSSRNVLPSTTVDEFPGSITDSNGKNKKGKLCVKPVRCKIETSVEHEFMKNEMVDSGFARHSTPPPPPPTRSSGFDDGIGFGDDGDDAFASPIVHKNKKIPMSPIQTGSLGLDSKVAGGSKKKTSMVAFDKGRPPKQSIMVVADIGIKKKTSDRTGMSHTFNSSLQNFSAYEKSNADLFASHSTISSDVQHPCHIQPQQYQRRPKLNGHYELRRSTLSTIRNKDAKQRKSQVLDSLSAFA